MRNFSNFQREIFPDDIKIQKYIKSMKRSETWLRYMLFPFIGGVILHFLVPIQLILISNPKIQSVYKSHSIETQQDGIRSVSLENARVFQNSLQMYENLRSTYLRLYKNPHQYQRIQLQNIKLNNAYQLASMNGNEADESQLSRSMWYMPGVQEISEMTPSQKTIFEGWEKLEPFLKSIFLDKSEIYQGLQTLKTTINKNNETLYIQYPSIKSQKFSTLNQNLLTEKYNITLFNYQNNQIEETTFAEGEILQLCEPLLENEIVIGISCLEINLYRFMKIPAFLLPKFDFSDNEYFLVKPRYVGVDTQIEPQVIMEFSDTNFSSLNFPLNKTFPYPKYLGQVSFTQKTMFSLYVYRYSIGHTSYVVPISTIDYTDNSTIQMYLIVLNHFIVEDLDIKSRQTSMLLATLIPSGAMLIISVIGTFLFLRWLFGDFSNVISSLNQLCSHIIRGDLHLSIPKQKAEDITLLFQEIRTLNELQQYSNPHFFDVPKPQRIIKYLKCYKLFDHLGYQLDNLCENIADCYGALKEFTNSIKYMKVSVEKSIESFQGKFGSIESIFKKKVKKEKMNPGVRKMEKVLRRRLNKLINFLYFLVIYEDDKSVDNFNHIRDNIDLLEKVAYPKIINIEYLTSSMIEIKLEKNQKKKLEKLQRIGKLLDIYHKQYQYDESCQKEQKKNPPDVMEGSWWFNMAQTLQQQKRINEAFWHYVQSLQYNFYSPSTHLEYHNSFKKMLYENGIDGGKLDKMNYNRNYLQRSDREYIFLSDISRSNVGQEKLEKWKKHCRQFTQHIFHSFIKEEDRISIIEFCEDLKVKVNLTYKRSQPKILIKELLTSIRVGKKNCESSPEFCLDKASKRVAHLQSQKWFIILIKPGIKVDGRSIQNIKQQVPNSQFIFVMENPDIMLHREEGYYVVDFVHGYEDAERILQEKKDEPMDSSIYVF